MHPLERKQRIKELIIEHQSLKISELSKELGVSEMTIHRDLKPLVEEDFVAKSYGRVTLQQNVQSTGVRIDSCVICRREVDDRLAHRLILENNQIETACCAHCGLLRHKQLGDKLLQAICTDFFQQTTISAFAAWYVVDTSIDMGCCHPQLLTFERKDHAANFVKGFGGKFYPFHEALEANFVKMHQSHSECNHD